MPDRCEGSSMVNGTACYCTELLFCCPHPSILNWHWGLVLSGRESVVTLITHLHLVPRVMLECIYCVAQPQTQTFYDGHRDRQERIKLFGAPRQWKHFRPLFQAVFLWGGGITPPDWVKHHASQSQDKFTLMFINERKRKANTYLISNFDSLEAAPSNLPP